MSNSKDEIEIYLDENSFCSFPSVVLIDGNKVLVAFRKAGNFSLKAGSDNNPTHHDNDSCICLITSTDGGQSYNKDDIKIVTKFEEFGVSDPGISILKNGRLLLRSNVIQTEKSSNRNKISAKITAHRPDLKTISAVVGQCIQYSDDSGKTWSDPEIINVSGSDDHFVSREQIIQLEDGSLICAAYTGYANQADNSYLLRSWDNGLNWSDQSLIASDGEINSSLFQAISFNETSIVNIGKGELLALIRGDSSYESNDNYMAIGGIGNIYSSRSFNAGFSWTRPESIDIFGQPPNVIKLKNGNLLCTYGYRKEPYSIKAIISNDNGLSWNKNEIITIRENASFWDMGYPVSVELSDGNILTAYYWIDKNSVRYITSNIWKIQ